MLRVPDGVTSSEVTHAGLQDMLRWTLEETSAEYPVCIVLYLYVKLSGTRDRIRRSAPF
jgi:hypothetical protein